MKTSYLDTPAARRTLEQVIRPFNVVSSLVMALLGGTLCLVGMFTGGLAWLHAGLPASTLVLLAGIVFSLISCPQFMLLSACRTLLRAIRELENRVEELKHDA